MGKKRLFIDFDQLEQTIREYETAIQNIQNSVTNLDRAMDYLEKSGWKSQASDVYFGQYEEKWRKSMETHIISLNHLISCLGEAKTQYTNLYTKAGSLANNL